ncbi:MAG: hypothetical protein ACRDQD_24650 [Nocardioidaceae bacterium]
MGADRVEAVVTGQPFLDLVEQGPAADQLLVKRLVVVQMRLDLLLAGCAQGDPFWRIGP